VIIGRRIGQLEPAEIEGGVGNRFKQQLARWLPFDLAERINDDTAN